VIRRVGQLLTDRRRFPLFSLLNKLLEATVSYCPILETNRPLLGQFISPYPKKISLASHAFPESQGLLPQIVKPLLGSLTVD
jgi:hypothetical protein